MPASVSIPDDPDWHACWHAHHAASYTVLQTGFDGGRQLLQAWSAWQQRATAPALAALHYLILAPHTACQFDSAQFSTGGLAPLARQLEAAWPPLTPGYHRLLLAPGQLSVTLIVGDVAAALAQLEASVDCFVLHDAVPASAAQWQRLARLAAPQARLHLVAPDAHAAAFETAGFIRSGASARFAPRWPVNPLTPPSVTRRAIVIGAGLAGSAACERLSARGWQVDLIEQHGQAAQETSGNLAGVYMPVISRDDNPTARLSRAAFLFAQQLWRQLGVFDPARRIGSACGVLQLARDAQQADSFEQAAHHWNYPANYAQWLPPAAASTLLGMPAGSGWWFPAGGWLHPAALCEALLQACGTRLQRHFHQRAMRLRHDGQNWQVLAADDTLLAQAPTLILANGMQALHFEQAAGLPLQAIRGQVSHVPAAQLPQLPLALCGDGYLTGAVDGMLSLGASYDQDDDGSVRLDSHLGNLAKLRQMLPQWTGQPDPAGWQGRVGFRCVAADRLPLVGELPDLPALAAAGEVQLKTLPRHAQLFSLLAYASRGLIWAPLAAEIVACRLNGEPAPLGKDELALLDPARFALKQHRRKPEIWRG